MTPVDLSVDLKTNGSLADFQKIFGIASAAKLSFHRDPVGPAAIVEPA
jgi:hypothetical protein